MRTRLLVLLVVGVASCGTPGPEACGDFAARLHEARAALHDLWSHRDRPDEAAWQTDLAAWKTKSDAVRSIKLPGGSFFSQLDRDRGPWLAAGEEVVEASKRDRAARAGSGSQPDPNAVRDSFDVVDREVALLTPETCKGATAR